MAKKVCFNCGKDLGEQQPYELKLTLVDVCKKCKTAIETAKRNKHTREFLLTGKF